MSLRSLVLRDDSILVQCPSILERRFHPRCCVHTDSHLHCRAILLLSSDRHGDASVLERHDLRRCLGEHGLGAAKALRGRWLARQPKARADAAVLMEPALLRPR